MSGKTNPGLGHGIESIAMARLSEWRGEIHRALFIRLHIGSSDAESAGNWKCLDKLWEKAEVLAPDQFGPLIAMLLIIISIAEVLDMFAFRPICCLLFSAETTHFPFFGGKRRRIKDNKNAFLAHFEVQFFWAVLTIKLGKFSHFWPKCRRQIGLMPHVYLELWTWQGIAIVIHAWINAKQTPETRRFGVWDGPTKKKH